MTSKPPWQMWDDFASYSISHFHSWSNLVPALMPTGFLTAILPYPNGWLELHGSKQFSSMPECDKIELVQATQHRFSDLLELHGAKTEHDLLWCYMVALRSTLLFSQQGLLPMTAYLLLRLSSRERLILLTAEICHPGSSIRHLHPT